MTTDLLAPAPNKGHRTKSTAWLAAEQARYYEIRLTLEKLRAGVLAVEQAHDLVLAYGEGCALRARDLARSAAEQRARRRLRAHGVEV